MENLNKKQGQGKTPQQYHDSSSFAWYGVLGMVILLILVILLSGCYGTYYISDSEYSDLRESHASVTYYDNQIYWGWHSGYYYYYGKPHYYPWYHYYNTCPPSHYTHTTHIIISNAVNKPTHRPNRPNRNITVKPNRNKTNIKINTNRNNTKVNTNRNNKVIIKNNNGSKRTNKTTIRRKPKK